MAGLSTWYVMKSVNGANKTYSQPSPGLPDGLFSNQKSQFGKNFEGNGIENVVTFYDHLEYFTVIWYNLQPFVIVCGHLVYFFVLECLEQENLATLTESKATVLWR
jgi:hypothetical protein